MDRSNLVGNIALGVMAVAIAVLLVLVLDGRLAPPSEEPGVAYATTTVNCKSGKSFKITTGNTSGACIVDVKGGVVTGGSCTDGANESRADCSTNGDGACGNTQGSGGCENVK